MKFNIFFALIASVFCFSFAYADEGSDLTSDPDHRANVAAKINYELKHVDKRLKVTKITKILSEYDPYTKIYIMETEFDFKDPNGHTKSCHATITTNGLNKNDDNTSVPYICFRLAGLG